MRFYNTKGISLTFSEKQQREMAKFKVVLLLLGHMTVNFALLFRTSVTSYRDLIALDRTSWTSSGNIQAYFSWVLVTWRRHNDRACVLRIHRKHPISLLSVQPRSFIVDKISIHLMLSFQSSTFKSKNNFQLFHKHLMELLALFHVVKDKLVLKRKAPNNNAICLEYYSHFQFFETINVERDWPLYAIGSCM